MSPADLRAIEGRERSRRLPASRTARHRAVFQLNVALAIVSTCVTANGAPPRAEENPTACRGGLVVSVDRHASRIGAEVLARGGNAIDAAVATALALAVTHPAAGNLGGGGFIVARLVNGEAFAVDFRETAPRAATAAMFLGAEGKPDPAKYDIGWLTVGVPGSPMGLWMAHLKGGRLPWADLVRPARELAAGGFVVDHVLAKSLARESGDFHRFGEPARVYFGPAEKPPAAGDTLRLGDLAKTLGHLEKHGPDGFYKGPVAEAIDKAMRENGGLVRKEDLAEYRAVIRKPVRGHYRGHDIISVPLPSSGGITIIESLNILSGYDLMALGRSVATTHLMIETTKRSFLDRARFLGDPDFTAIDETTLLSPKRASDWRKSITDRATASRRLGADLFQPKESDQTTHLSVIDREGAMVSLTTTLEGNYGAKVMAPGTGFLLNNEMHDFNIWPGVTDESGHIGTPANGIEPGKRMLSSQSPTLVLKDGRPFLVIGSPGGRTIISTVLETIVNVIDHRLPIQDAIDAARWHHGWMPDIVQLERRAPKEWEDGLAARGHQVRRIGAQGDCHAILIDPSTGRYIPGVDRRIRGAAFGF